MNANGEWKYITILDLGTRWRRVVSLKPSPPRYELDRRLGWPKNHCVPCGEEENIALPGMDSAPSSLWIFDITAERISDQHTQPILAVQNNVVWIYNTRIIPFMIIYVQT
jgi:hypothetical protein